MRSPPLNGPATAVEQGRSPFAHEFAGFAPAAQQLATIGFCFPERLHS